MPAAVRSGGGGFKHFRPSMSANNKTIGKFQWNTAAGEKKYGLIKPGGSKSNAASVKSAGVAKALVPSMFSADDDQDGESDVNRAIMAQSIRNRMDKKVVIYIYIML